MASSFRITRRAFSALAALVCVLLAAPAAAQDCRGTIYLTFDPGNMSQAEYIARTLREEDVKATFFVANKPTFRHDHALDPSWGSYWKSLVADGHAFGDHTWSHVYVRRDLPGGRLEAVDGNGKPIIFTRASYCEELTRVDEAFHRETGRHLDGIWRAPGWRTTYQSLRDAASCGYPVHIATTDAGYIRDDLPNAQVSNQELLDHALHNLRAGDIVSMHLGVADRREPGALILKPLIDGLKRRGMCFATIDTVKR
jgi:peptidoglycan/xylan/chitin deacetylase (PgdA/CDA1 family)